MTTQLKTNKQKQYITYTYAGEFEPTFCNLQVGLIKAG